MMDWNRLLSRKRLAKPPGDPRLPHRSPFEIDADRITFSTSFRRLQDKQQVYGIGGSDYVRSRLTHSLEVSRVARSLGAWVGREVLARGGAAAIDATPFDFGQVAAAAALAHDLGTPCFAHSGEDIISEWFRHSDLGRDIAASLPPEARAEASRFEGNAQGFRVLARLQGWRAQGGLQLTVATLAAYTKYPWRLAAGNANPRAARGKYGIFASEEALFAEVAAEAGLIPVRAGLEWCRHPLAYLVEAADDICYRIVDIEDAVKMNLLKFDEAEELLAPLAEPIAAEYAPIEDTGRKLIYLRARAIDRLVSDAAAAFLDHHDAIMAGAYVDDLIAFSAQRDGLRRIEEVSQSRIYNHERRYETDIIAGRAIWTLLDHYGRALIEREAVGAGGRLSRRARSLIECMPDPGRIPYDREGWVRALLDYVAGMTDRFAMRQADLVGG